MDVHNGVFNVPPTANTQREEAEGRSQRVMLRLSEELARSYGMSYRQLWRKVKKDPEKYGAEQAENHNWYLPAGTDISRERTIIDEPMKSRIKDALKQQRKAAVIARSEGIAESTVYRVKQEHYEELLDKEEELPGLVGVHMRDGFVVRSVDFSVPEINHNYLDSIVKLGEEAYLDPHEHVLHVSQEKLEEIDRNAEDRKKTLQKHSIDWAAVAEARKHQSGE